MKTMLGWLGDPYLHLVAIGAIVVAVGSSRGTDKAAADEPVIRCDDCHRLYVESKPCTHGGGPGSPAAE